MKINLRRYVSPKGFIRNTAAALLLAVAGLSCACSSGGHTPDPDGNGRSIGFGIQETTRATVTTSVRKIGVMGYSHTGSFGSDLTMRIPDYFLNQAVSDLPGDGTWTYSGVSKYWPGDGRNVSFFAYAPYLDVQGTFTLYPAAISQTGAPKITYTVPAGILDQTDLLWSNKLDMTYASSNGGKVEFTMDHALTRVDFKAKIDDSEKGSPFIVEIESITVENIVGSGTLDMSKSIGDSGLWTITRPANDSGWAHYELTPGASGGLDAPTFDTRIKIPAVGEVDAWNYNSLLKTGQYLMLIPQSLTDAGDGLTPAQVTIKYSVTNVLNGEIANREETIPLAKPTLQVWSAGQGVNYLINLSPKDGSSIELDIEGFISGTPWDDKNSSNPIEGEVN